ncbi:MAG: hypothetical protein KAT28_05800 [Candidatus Aenigmarchaeota archaeon]|nr:hypothetical protein [Candidatus Aenigmarchaeota archaeon]
MEKLKTKLDIKRMENDIIKQISPGIEERIKFEVVKTITDALEEQFYPPEKMIKKEFIKKIENAEKEEGISFKNIEELKQHFADLNK